MIDTFDRLMLDIHNCRDCRKTFGFEPNPVFGGNRNAKILQISQAPSRNVHDTNKSFNDSSGKKLKYEWYGITDEVFYDTSNFFITGIANCYPGKDKNGGDKKPPKHCADKWLAMEMKLIDNRIYIIIGRVAASYLFPKKDFDELIFNDQELNGKLALVLPHPSPLNRKWFKDHPDFEKKRLVVIRNIVQRTLKLQKTG